MLGHNYILVVYVYSRINRMCGSPVEWLNFSSAFEESGKEFVNAPKNQS